jgi:hypothetical protein
MLTLRGQVVRSVDQYIAVRPEPQPLEYPPAGWAVFPLLEQSRSGSAL